MKCGGFFCLRRRSTIGKKSRSLFPATLAETPNPRNGEDLRYLFFNEKKGTGDYYYVYKVDQMLDI
ncbi:MAG: hypothetical protein ACFFCQ_15775 [Promethearchaeota archaeon]